MPNYLINSTGAQQRHRGGISLLMLLIVLLAGFSTTISASQKQLTWDPPMKREDGSSLYPGEIQGYRIHVGVDKANNAKSLGLAKVSENSVIVNGMLPGVYEFAVSAVDTDGLESRRSESVRVVVSGKTADYSGGYK